MELQERLSGLSDLGRFLDEYLARTGVAVPSAAGSLDPAVRQAEEENPWFTRTNILFALSELARILREPYLNRWVSGYNRRDMDPSRIANVGVIMAGNLPLVGFHDFLSVLVSGGERTAGPTARAAGSP